MPVRGRCFVLMPASTGWRFRQGRRLYRGFAEVGDSAGGLSATARGAPGVRAVPSGRAVRVWAVEIRTATEVRTATVPGSRVRFLAIEDFWVRPVDIQGSFWPLDGCEANPLFCFAIWMDTGRTRILPCHMGGCETNPGSRLHPNGLRTNPGLRPRVQMDTGRTLDSAHAPKWTQHEPRAPFMSPDGRGANPDFAFSFFNGVRCGVLESRVRQIAIERFWVRLLSI